MVWINHTIHLPFTFTDPGERSHSSAAAHYQRRNLMSGTAKAIPVDGYRPGFGRIFGAFGANPYYRTYWFGNQASTLMMMMQGVAQGYLAYQLTGSAGALGIVGLAQGLPQLLLSPFGGVIA